MFSAVIYSIDKGDVVTVVLSNSGIVIKGKYLSCEQDELVLSRIPEGETEVSNTIMCIRLDRVDCLSLEGVDIEKT